jgi:hypothetical protein
VSDDCRNASSSLASAGRLARAHRSRLPYVVPDTSRTRPRRVQQPDGTRRGRVPDSSGRVRRIWPTGTHNINAAAHGHGQVDYRLVQTCCSRSVGSGGVSGQTTATPSHRPAPTHTPRQGADGRDAEGLRRGGNCSGSTEARKNKRSLIAPGRCRRRLQSRPRLRHTACSSPKRLPPRPGPICAPAQAAKQRVVARGPVRPRSQMPGIPRRANATRVRNGLQAAD